MRISTILFIAGAFFCSFQTYADDCSNAWFAELATDPTLSRSAQGDSAAGYGIFQYRPRSDMGLRLQGNVPNARFFSIQTYSTEAQLGGQVLFDKDIKLDSAAGAGFSVDVIPPMVASKTLNVLRRGIAPIEVIMVRIYAPNAGKILSMSDLPKVISFDLKTGGGAACPEIVPVKTSLDQVQFLSSGTVIPFSLVPVQPFGPNAAIPNYVTAGGGLAVGSLTEVEFMAPTFAARANASSAASLSNTAEVRYWSLCVTEPDVNATIACIPDYAARMSANGKVRVVFGPGSSRESVENSGANFIQDDRNARSARTISFVYRNLLPTDDFATSRMYRGEYLPRAVVCPTKGYPETCDALKGQ